MKLGYVYDVTVRVELEREDTYDKPGEAAVRHAVIDHMLNQSPVKIRLIEEYNIVDE